MTETTKKTSLFSVRLSQEERTQLETVARAQRMKPSEVIRNWIRRFYPASVRMSKLEQEDR